MDVGRNSRRYASAGAPAYVRHFVAVEREHHRERVRSVLIVVYDEKWLRGGVGR
jgi:hypothetical protein